MAARHTTPPRVPTTRRTPEREAEIAATRRKNQALVRERRKAKEQAAKAPPQDGAT